MAKTPTPRKDWIRGRLRLDSLIEGELNDLRGKTVLVVGDLMLDRYLWGSVERTSPQAPVPVLRYEREGNILGGAANVARNLRALGGRPLLVGVVGRDTDADILRAALADEGIAASGLLTDPARPTTVKMRVASRGQELLRIDYERSAPLDPALRRRLHARIEKLIPRAAVVVLSDYAKGVLDPESIAAIAALARRHGLPVLADPKGSDYSRYRGVDLLTPNQLEAGLATGRKIVGEEELDAAAREIIRRCELKALIVTRGPEGVAVLRPRRKTLAIPARAREVYDDTGAGDSFIAVLALGIAAGLSLEDAAAIANHAGGIVVGKLGVATVTRPELHAALDGQRGPSKVRALDDLKIALANQQTLGRKVVFTNGCFDLLHPGHIQFLHEAKRLGDILVVGLNTDRSVRAVKGPLRPILGEEARASILSALEDVDFLIFYDEETPEQLLRELRPDVLVKGRNIPRDHVVGRAIVEQYGGRVCRLPILHSANVTDLLDSIAGKLERSQKRR